MYKDIESLPSDKDEEYIEQQTGTNVFTLKRLNGN